MESPKRRAWKDLGQMLIEAIRQSSDCVLSGALDVATSPAIGHDAAYSYLLANAWSPIGYANEEPASADILGDDLAIGCPLLELDLDRELDRVAGRVPTRQPWQAVGFTLLFAVFAHQFPLWRWRRDDPAQLRLKPCRFGWIPTDRGICHVARTVNHEESRERFDPEGRRNLGFDVDCVWIGRSCLCQGSTNGIHGIGGDANDIEARAGQALMPALDRGHRDTTGSAPDRPEIDERRPPLRCTDARLARPIEPLKTEGRRRPTDEGLLGSSWPGPRPQAKGERVGQAITKSPDPDLVTDPKCAHGRDDVRRGRAVSRTYRDDEIAREEASLVGRRAWQDGGDSNALRCGLEADSEKGRACSSAARLRAHLGSIAAHEADHGAHYKHASS